MCYLYIFKSYIYFFSYNENKSQDKVYYQLQIKINMFETAEHKQTGNTGGNISPTPAPFQLHLQQPLTQSHMKLSYFRLMKAINF